MDVALTTSKRKFHKILETISKSASPSDPRSIRNGSSVSLGASTAQRPAKRLRTAGGALPDTMSRPQSTNHDAQAYSQHLGIPSSANTRGNSVRLIPSGVHATEDQRLTPNYAPWSQQAFLDRLSTFSDVKLWRCKPEPISEVEWAKRGWICEAPNTVACKGGCEKRVVIKLRPDTEDTGSTAVVDLLNIDADKNLAARYADIIVSGHEEFCLWRKSGCKDDIYRLALARASVWQPALTERYRSLLAINEKLPTRTRAPMLAEITELARYLPKQLFDGHEDGQDFQEQSSQAKSTASHNLVDTSESINITALKFALFGWSGDEVCGNAIARCKTCFQRLGLWLYASKTPRPTENDRDENDEENGLTVNLAESHRIHCPWLNPKFQAATGDFAGLAGWEILQRVIQMNRRQSGQDQVAAVAEDMDMDAESALSVQEVSIEEVETADRARLSKLNQLKRSFSFRKLKNLGKRLKDSRGVGIVQSSMENASSDTLASKSTKKA